MSHLRTAQAKASNKSVTSYAPIARALLTLDEPEGARMMCKFDVCWLRRRALPLRNSRPANWKLAMRLTLATPTELPRRVCEVVYVLHRASSTWAVKVVSDHVRPFLEVVWHVVRSLGKIIFVSGIPWCTSIKHQKHMLKKCASGRRGIDANVCSLTPPWKHPPLSACIRPGLHFWGGGSSVLGAGVCVYLACYHPMRFQRRRQFTRRWRISERPQVYNLLAMTACVYSHEF